MTQYARPNNDDFNPEHGTDDGAGGTFDGWITEGYGTSNIYASIDESSTDDNDYIKQEDGESGTLPWYKAGLGNTVTDPVTALDDHKIKFRAVGYDSTMGGTPTLTVALYEGASLIITHDETSLPDENEMAMPPGTWADFTISLNSTQAGNIGTYNDLVLWFKITSNGMGDYVKISQAWFECADVPAVAATTSPAFLLFLE